jgi:hypothetical protein
MAPPSKKRIVNDAVISIVSDSCLRGKWVSLLTLGLALKQRHDFGDHLELTSMQLGSMMTKLAPDVDSLLQSSNGMCRIQHSYEKEDSFFLFSR